MAETLELLQYIVFYDTPPKVKQSKSTLSFMAKQLQQLGVLRGLSNEDMSDHLTLPNSVSSCIE